MEEGNQMTVALRLRVPRHDYRRVEQLAKDGDRPVAAEFRRLLRQGLAVEATAAQSA